MGRVGLGVVLLVLTLPSIAAAQSAPPIPDQNARPAMTTGPDGAQHVVWIEGPPGDQELLYSVLDGVTWSEPETVVSGISGLSPEVLVDPDGQPCVYWTLIPLFESCRVDGTWTAPVEVAVEAASSDFQLALTPEGDLRIMHLEAPNGVYYGDTLLNPADEVVTFPEFVSDSDGGLHAFWFDFTPDRGWVWSSSTDDGATWEPFESLSLSLPQAGGTLAAAAPDGGVHSVLLMGFRFEHRRWTPGSGWSGTELVEFTPGAIEGDLAVADDGSLTLVAATSEGVLVFGAGPDGGWVAQGLVPGTEERSIDAVLAGAGDDGQVTVLWHEVGAVGFNQAQVGGESLVSSVPSPAEINLDPAVVAVSVGLTAGTIFLFPFPAEIFNQTLAQNYDSIRGWFRRGRSQKGGRRFWDRPLGLALFLVVAAFLYGFLDPGFGLDSASAAVFLGLLIGVTVTTVGFALPAMVLRRARNGEWGRLRALPIALAIGVACVILSRAIGFVPGYLYAIVLAVVFVSEASRAEEAREVILSSVSLLAMGLAAWVWLGVVRSGDGSGFGADVGEAGLAMVTASALEALAFGLLPLHGLPGGVIFKERKWWWLVMWGVSVLVFFHVIINPQNGYLASSALVPAATTIGLLVLFALVSLGLWGFFAIRGRRAGTDRPVTGV
jgi:hypothetical protein